MSLGSFILIKNEADWIAPHILSVLDYIDEMVFYDGNSTDGTLEIIREIRDKHPHGKKIRLFTDKDPKNLRDDYVKLFDECMHELSTDLAWFLHPDMIVENPESLLKSGKSKAFALTTSLRSFAGEPGGKVYEMSGRAAAWKNIYRLKNPDLGAHYFGHYGAGNEDVYFSAVTGDEHIHYGTMVNAYPYQVDDSGIKVLHYSDVRPFSRRLSRMETCLVNQGLNLEDAKQTAASHPRVTLKDGQDASRCGYRFIESEYSKSFIEAKKAYQHLVKEPLLVNA